MTKATTTKRKPMTKTEIKRRMTIKKRVKKKIRMTIKKNRVTIKKKRAKFKMTTMMKKRAKFKMATLMKKRKRAMTKRRMSIDKGKKKRLLRIPKIQSIFSQISQILNCKFVIENL